MAYIRDKSEELTGYQAGEAFRPSVDLGCDFVMVYGIDDTMPERIRQYRDSTSLFSIFITLIPFSYLTALARTSSTILNR